MRNRPELGAPVLVLLHGAGHTSRVWRSTQRSLRHRSIALDIPGRRDRRADIAAVTIDAAADSIAADVRATTTASVVVVGHSAGGILLPAVAARLGPRVEHLVFVAGLCAPHGSTVADVVRPGYASTAAAKADDLRERYKDHMFVPQEVGDAVPIHDAKVAQTIDSMNLMAQVVSWHGVPETLGRTFVRCARDDIQSPEMQARLIESCAASRVIDLDTGHTPALEAPAQLARVLDQVGDDLDVKRL